MILEWFDWSITEYPLLYDCDRSVTRDYLKDDLSNGHFGSVRGKKYIPVKPDESPKNQTEDNKKTSLEHVNGTILVLHSRGWFFWIHPYCFVCLSLLVVIGLFVLVVCSGCFFRVGSFELIHLGSLDCI